MLEKEQSDESVADDQAEKQIQVEVDRKSAEGSQVHEERAVQVLTLAWFVFIYGGGESASTPCTSDNFRYSKNFDVKSNTQNS